MMLLLVNAFFRRYNNKTYRIVDINWDENPTATFKLADGSEISFVEYYQKVCLLFIVFNGG